MMKAGRYWRDNRRPPPAAHQLETTRQGETDIKERGKRRAGWNCVSVTWTRKPTSM
jgi:hypothetical protein